MIVGNCLAGKGVFELCQADGQHAADFVLGNDLGPEVSVPAVGKGDQRHGEDGGLAHGDQHIPDGTQTAQAINAACVDVALVNGHERVPQHEDVVSGNCFRQNQAQERIAQVPVGTHDVDGDERDLQGDHQRAQHHIEQDVAALEAAHRETIRRQDAGAHLQQQDARRHDDGVPVVFHEVGFLEHVEIVFGVELMREERGDDQLHFLGGLERRCDHPVQREEHDQGNDDSHNGLCMVAHGIFFVLVRLVDLFDQSRVVHSCILRSHVCILLSKHYES